MRKAGKFAEHALLHQWRRVGNITGSSSTCILTITSVHVSSSMVHLRRVFS